MMIRTGHVCDISGTYRSACRCHQVITVKSGETFPRCPICLLAVEWLLVEPEDT